MSFCRLTKRALARQLPAVGVRPGQRDEAGTIWPSPVARRPTAPKLVPFLPGMHDPAKFEALQIAAIAAVRHSHQGEQLLHQAVAEVSGNPMGLAVGTP